MKTGVKKKGWRREKINKVAEYFMHYLKIALM